MASKRKRKDGLAFHKGIWRMRIGRVLYLVAAVATVSGLAGAADGSC